MNNFDVVVIGAGPAGGQMARLMTKSGYKVLLVEQHEDFSKNDFSSAVTPLSTLDRFDLPEEIIGSYWNNFVVVTTNIRRNWDSPENLGAVLDFAKLKEFLAKDVKSCGGEVWMGYRYVRHFQDNEKTLVTLKQRSGGKLETVSTKVLVDATGFARSVMYNKQSDKPKLLSATGIEYVIEVDEAAYNQYLNSIFFFLGYKWMPKGYSWIFPMEKGRLKVGAGRFNLEHKNIKHTESLQYYIQLLIDKHVMPKEYKIIDIHGSTIKYCQGLKDIYYKDNAIAVGDAVSTVNFLGGEGIRHGMYSAELAATHINRYLENQISDFRDYQNQMRRYFLPKWEISAKAGVNKYLIESDKKIDESFTYLGLLTTEEIIAVLFEYKLGKLKKGFVKYLMSKIQIPNFFKEVGDLRLLFKKLGV
ncbi:NAD(P)/FAD-dependent oxidoreductase [Komarekiella sp. 'clone 1']|uniref:NAD(P)/FAD-dependent oxidoreductase n=1 Tax=Komarekiella delphini-convector SJRDD-AB1 TaxID=2593771 RepID=A0AA40T2L1_9NOST|nr:NAD(P)/FAD-dependent oxidoreductase [Komarekiella delphini-convector]MBD6619776.1 NAD(P)/FAD-dependent oxidoreductase [Komarekiella delphini-convector SJRDD-AB1]